MIGRFHPKAPRHGALRLASALRLFAHPPPAGGWRRAGSALGGPGAAGLELYMDTHTGRGLYREAYERDSCGFGLIASLDDKPSHWLVRTDSTFLNRLSHHWAIAGDRETGHGT